MRKILLVAMSLGAVAAGQSIEGTRPLTIQGDPAAQMVEGITKYLSRETDEHVSQRRPSRERLRKILGVADSRSTFANLDLVATSVQSALLAGNEEFEVYAVSWPTLAGVTAEGLWFKPRRRIVARVVALPDADQIPERLLASQVFAASGCEVLSPVLIGRENTWSGNPRIRMTNQPHREFLYRMAFMVGRHPSGYEVQKTLAAVDWFSAKDRNLPIGVWGYGEGGAIALFAAALDDRIAAAGVSGYFAPREGLWKEPLYRNVFGLLKDFGDAEMAGMVAPRALVIDTTPGPAWNGPSEGDPKRRGAAPGILVSATRAAIEHEFVRARQFYRGSKLVLSTDGVGPFLKALGTERNNAASIEVPERDVSPRQHRQFDQLVKFTQELALHSHLAREALWRKTERLKPEQWSRIAPAYRAKLWDEVIGRLPASSLPLNVRTRRSYGNTKWDGHEVAYDVLPQVFGYGVLLIPKDLRPGERRPVIVAQHGLDGRPQHLFGQEEKDSEGARYTRFHLYQNVGSRLAGLGYVVYLPQSPYIGDFRKINRLANPLGWSLFSFILAQQERLLDWLASLNFVDTARIGFYGFSYGGKTAMRVPPLLDRYAFSICSGDFNEWVYKVTAVDEPFSYMFTGEYEIPEFDLASVANHAEMAKMMAPRPFMVERGHRDGIGRDEWVAFEYAKVKRFYDGMGIGDRTVIEYFNGPHMIHGVGTIEFIRKYFGR